jgi:nicotinamidase-related amidase
MRQPGALAEWLGTGLQNLVHRFDSGRRLITQVRLAHGWLTVQCVGNRQNVKDALVVVDALNEFDHEDGDKLLASFQERVSHLRAAIESARASGVPVVYVNDHFGCWDGDAPGLVRRALRGKGGDVVAAVQPLPGDSFVFKDRYSAFDHTLLELLLRQLEIERVLLVGATTEACVVQTGIDARELGYNVTIIAGACATIDQELEDLALRYAEAVAGIFVVQAFANR